MEHESEIPLALKNQAIDYAASGARAALGAVPFVGSLLIEVATSIIPRQRIDRIVDFATKLEARIRSLEQIEITSELNNEEFTDLVEEALRQSARATSEARREYIASLVANSLKSEDIEHAESKHLMRMLGELNDVEILWLRFYARPGINEDEEFRTLHQSIFQRKIAHLSSTPAELEDHAIQQSYRDHLVQMGLVKGHVSKDGNGPEFDRITGDFIISYYRTTTLGYFLLKSIGFKTE